MVIFLHLQEKVPTLIAIDSAACSADPDQISRRLNQLVCMYTFCLSLINSCLAGQELNVDIYNEVLGFCPWVDESLCSKSPVFASRQQASFASHLINVNYNKTNTFSIYCLVSLYLKLFIGVLKGFNILIGSALHSIPTLTVFINFFTLILWLPGLVMFLNMLYMLEYHYISLIC